MDNFDPQSPDNCALFQRILGTKSQICPLKGFQGGLNEGIWQVVEESEILKLVKAERICNGVPTEAENTRTIASRFPNLLHDEAVCFPFKIIHIVSGNAPVFDLFVMRMSMGRRLAEVVSEAWRKDHQEVYDLFLRFGQFLAAFHQRYENTQHVDVQPSNIFYDADARRFTLIDVGGMGMNCSETDVEHFNKSLDILSNSYGKDLREIGGAYFEKGYFGLDM